MTPLRSAALAAALLASAGASAGNVDPACQDVARPADYDEQLQQDFMANSFALALTLSPLHKPIADEAGHGSLGVDVLALPPLSCEHRFVLDHTKTEDTNLTPAAPRLRATFAFPAVGATHLYAGAAYVPPVQMFGTRNVIAGGELGAGWQLSDRVEAGIRGHYTTLKTVAEIATPFTAGGEAYDDYYNASTLGVDAMAGLDLAPAVRPYLAAGILDASTFFWVGDDSVVVNNLHPYLGPAASLGVDGLVAKDRLRYGLELYAAPGGHNLPRGMTAPDPSAAHLTFADSGHLYTARLRVAWEL